MTTRMRAIGALLACASTIAAALPAAAADRAYTEGSVSTISALRTEPGMFDAYMRYLAGPYKQAMEEQKKAGIILSYAVFQATPRGPHDPDIYLIVEYKNMAALDGLNERTDPIQERLFGNLEQRGAAAAERGKMRSPIGLERVRKLELK